MAEEADGTTRILAATLQPYMKMLVAAGVALPRHGAVISVQVKLTARC
jgi:hypothetical protein